MAPELFSGLYNTVFHPFERTKENAAVKYYLDRKNRVCIDYEQMRERSRVKDFVDHCWSYVTETCPHITVEKDEQRLVLDRDLLTAFSRKIQFTGRGEGCCEDNTPQIHAYPCCLRFSFAPFSGYWTDIMTEVGNWVWLFFADLHFHQRVFQNDAILEWAGRLFRYTALWEHVMSFFDRATAAVVFGGLAGAMCPREEKRHFSYFRRCFSNVTVTEPPRYRNVDSYFYVSRLPNMYLPQLDAPKYLNHHEYEFVLPGRMRHPPKISYQYPLSRRAAAGFLLNGFILQHLEYVNILSICKIAFDNDWKPAFRNLLMIADARNWPESVRRLLKTGSADSAVEFSVMHDDRDMAFNEPSNRNDAEILAVSMETLHRYRSFSEFRKKAFTIFQQSLRPCLKKYMSGNVGVILMTKIYQENWPVYEEDLESHKVVFGVHAMQRLMRRSFQIPPVITDVMLKARPRDFWEKKVNWLKRVKIDVAEEEKKHRFWHSKVARAKMIREETEKQTLAREHALEMDRLVLPHPAGPLPDCALGCDENQLLVDFPPDDCERETIRELLCQEPPE